MVDFFANTDWDVAQTLERLSRLSFELRESRDGVLRYYGIRHEDELRARIAAGDVAEHPAFEHVLAMRILHDSREAVRRQIAAGMKAAVVDFSLHVPLKRFVDAAFAADVQDEAVLTQDALTIRLKNGIVLVVHYAAPEEYALRWGAASPGGGEWQAGIDTSAVRHAVSTQPNHMHLADGRVVADPFTRVGAPPEENLRALLEALRANPRLGLEG